MPKLKTNSSAKKRFRFSATGKVKFFSAGKRHGMSKRPQRMIRNARGPMILSEQDTAAVYKMMPYQ